MKQMLRAKIQNLRNIENSFENSKTIYLVSCGILLANTILGYSEIVRWKITQKDRTNAKKVCHSNWNSPGRRGLKMDFTTYYPTNTHHISNKRRKPLKKKCCYSRKTTSNRRSPQTDCAILCTKDTPLKEDAFSWWFIRRTFISYRQCNCTAQKEVLISTKKHRTEEASR
jgi:hypothetical protein